jgi:AAA family ATP:ADP antiporter
VGRAIERVIGADIQPGEGRVVLVFFANLFLLLTAYYVLKVIREPLILMGGGAVSRSYARGLQAVLLTAAIPVYGILANRIDPTHLIKLLMLFFAACLALFYGLGRAGVSVGFAFFVWLGIFSTMAIAQFWSLANDLLTESEGKRLFPVVAIGGTIGGIAGAQIAARAARWLDPFSLMLVAGALVLGCAALTHLGHTLGVERRRQSPATIVAAPRDRRGGFTLLFQDRYLLLVALAVLLLNLVNTTGDFILARMVNDHAHTIASGTADGARAQRQFIAAFYGDFQTYITVLTAFVQIVLVARVFRGVGVGRALFFLPLLATAGYGASALLPALALLATVKVLENSADYSLQNTIQQALFLTTSRDAKYKAKAAVDTVAVRLGDLASTGLVFVGVHLALGTAGFALVNFAAGLLWILIVIPLARRHRHTAQPARQGAEGLPVTASG